MDLGNDDRRKNDPSGNDGGDTRKGLSRRAIMQGAAWTVPAVMLSTTVPAYAASAYCPGGALYNAQARGRFLSGALGTLNLDNVVAFRGAHAAAWDSTKNPFTSYPGYPGPATSPTYFDTQVTNVDLTALNALTASVGLGLNVGAPVGLYKNYAYAERDGHEIGASGAITDSGAINLTGGNAGEPQLGSLSLRTILQNVTNPGGAAGAALTTLITNITNLDLVIGALAGRAEQTACTLAIARTYLISYLRLIAQSNIVSTLATNLQSGGVRNAVNAAINTALAGLGALTSVLPPGLLTVNSNLTLGIVTAQDTPPQPNALSLNLGAGTATLDIGTLVGGLNSLPPNTRLFVDAPILSSVGAATLVNQWATNSLGNVVTLTGNITLAVLGVNVATITIAPGTTVTQLISGQGITVTGTSAAVIQPILGLVAQTIGNTVLSTLLGLNQIANQLTALQNNVISPLFTVLQSIILIAVNLQNAAPSSWTLPADFTSLPADGANGNTKGQYDVAALHVGVVTGIVLPPAYPVVNLHVGRGSVGETYLR